jgi:hypothetical protein
LTKQAREDVLGACGGKADNYAHLPCRIRLRRCDARNDGQCGSAYGQTQELSSVKKLHDLSLEEMGVTELLGQSALMPANFTTLAQFS